MASTRRDIFKMLDGITNRRGVGYARYSSDMQKDGRTIQAQTRTITTT
jgi:predicted site-specific integrase-resolvase